MIHTLDPISFEPIHLPDIDDIETDGTSSDDDTGDDPNPTFCHCKQNFSSRRRFIIYTITTTNIENGSILYYTLSGEGITPSDIVGKRLTGEFVIQDNEAKITVGIRR